MQMQNESALITKARALPEERQERLAKILDDYLIAADCGKPISPEELLAQHPDDSAYLREYLSGLNLFHNATTELQNFHSSSKDSVICQSPGQTIGDFRLVREIGRGGMGVVYEAEQLSLKRLVALKVLPYVAANNKKNLQRFHSESQTAASIDHPNIVPVYAIGQEHGVHFFAMQLIEGKSLTEFLGQQSSQEHSRGSTTTAATRRRTTFASIDLPMNIAQKEAAQEEQVLKSSSAVLGNRKLRDHVFLLADLGSQAAEALHAAHEYGIVHRDVKPSNLLIDNSGKLWITDFGLARCREGSGLTQTGDILGTLRYMSPEQASGNGNLVDHRTDVFSLGITLYEAASGQHPFNGDDIAIFAQERRCIIPLRNWDRRIPVDFETIVMKALGELPVDRYSTASEMAADLRRFAADEPIHARRLSLPSRVGRWAKRHRRSVLSAALALVFAVAALSVALFSLARETAQKEIHVAQVEVLLQKARKVLDEDSRLAEQLAAIPGAEGVRYQLLDKNLKYYHEIANQAADDTTLTADVALAYSKIGELTAETGRVEDALAFHRRAKLKLEILLGKEEGENYELARSLAVCMNNIGMSLLNLGRENDAFESCSQALAIQQRLLDKAPNSSEILTDAATTHSNLGLVHMRLHSTEKAAAAFRKAVALQQQVVDANEVEESLRTLALGYSNLASTHEESSVAEAKEFYGRAISIQKTLVKGQPHNLIYQSDLARTYNNLGFLATKERDWLAANQCYESAIKIQQRLVESAPAIAAYRRDLAVSQNNLGMALTQAGNFVDARDLFAKAAKLQRKLLVVKPQDLRAMMSLGGILNNVGMLLEKQQDLSAASKAFHQAVEYQSQALKLSPGSQRVRELLSNHLFNHAQCCHRLGRTEEALSISIRRRRVWHDVPERLLGVAKEILSYRTHSVDRSNHVASGDEQILKTSLDTVKLALECGLSIDRLRDESLAALEPVREFQSLRLGGREHISPRAAAHSTAYRSSN